MANNAWLLSYYYDADGTREIPHDAEGNYNVDFGEEARIHPPIAGETSVSLDIYVKNTHPDLVPMELRPATLDPDLEITEYPDFLEPDQIGHVKLVFSPSANRIKPLSKGSWDFEKLVYSK